MQDELLDKREVCRRLGGTKPINPVTLYRWIKLGRAPKQIKVGLNTSRWLRSEIDACLKAMVEGRAV